MIKQFVVGKTYSVRSACNYDCVWNFKVLRRTKSTITIIVDGKEKACRINQKEAERYGYESVMPFGRYSMAPCLSAD